MKRWTNEEIEFLRENYNKLTYKEISLKLKRNVRAIATKCLRLKLKKDRKAWNIGIPRDEKTKQKISFKNSEKIFTEEEINFIKNNYLNMTNREIANILNCKKDCIKHKLKLLELKRDSISILKIKKRFAPNRDKKLSESWRKNIGKSRLGKSYPELSKSLRKLFTEGKIIPPMLGKNHSLESRKKASCTKRGITIDKWDRFTGYEPYDIEWNGRFKNLIRKRDNQICMLCGIHREKLNKALDVHHINNDREPSIPQNCISLCRKCHAITFKNREYWTKFFQDLLSQKYGYKYEKGEIVLEIKNEN